MNDALATVSSRLRTVFRHGEFARYMAGEAVSMTGTWMQVMAQGWVMTSLTTSAMMLGMVNFAAGLPMLALSLWGGALADRHDRRLILQATQVVQIALALLLGWLVATDRVQVWHIILLATVLGISGAFEMPAASALVPELVPKEHVASAIAIDRSVFHGTRLVGPALAGYVIGQWGTASAFYINALSFVALMAALASIRPRQPGTAEEEAQRQSGIKEGIAYVRSDRPTLAMIGVMALTTVFVFPVIVVMLPLYARHELHLGPDRMGLLMAISSVGSVTGSISLLAVPRRRRFVCMAGAIVFAATALIGLSLARQFAVAASCLVMLSLGVSTLIGLAQTVVQERAPGPLRGRVSAVSGLSFFGLMPFASIGITALADGMGMRRLLLLSAALFLMGAATVLIGARPRLAEPIDRLRTTPASS
jgi:MFS family permease